MNYVNLATARSVTRSKEVGIRKVLGSKRFSILSQFIMESVLFTVCSGVLAVGLVIVWLPQLNTLLDLDLSYQLMGWKDWGWVVAGLLLTGIAAGILPSLAMSKLPALSNARPAIQFRMGQWSLTRKLFIGIQYAVTLALLIASFVIYRQYHYLKNFDKGFDSNQLLHLAVDDRVLQTQLDILKTKMLQIPGVMGVTATGEDLPSELNNTWGLDWNGSNLEKPLGIDIVGVDRDYFELLGIEFKAGKNFIHEYPVDSARSVILNEKAHGMIGQEDLIGQILNIGGRDRTVIGVVGDHHNTTLHSQITPLAYFVYPPGFRVSPDNLLLKLQTNNLPALLAQLEVTWEAFSSDPIEYNFVDEAFAEAYQAEQRFSHLISTFTILAIVISMIGLFGLINFIAQLKIREISIRRILGAGSLHLMHMLGRDFLIVFCLSSLFAIPVSYYFMNAWLANYAYHLPVSISLLLSAVLMCLAISLLVIFYHLYRTTRVNPLEVLAGE